MKAPFADTTIISRLPSSKEISKQIYPIEGNTTKKVGNLLKSYLKAS